jgi:SAM-dependent methyltransferase
VGIDLDPDALARNARIDERIVGDILTYPFQPDSFDVILCQDVLEHLPEPAVALRNFARWVKPGGRIILGFPNVMSLKGLITKFTPHAFHLWFYRRILGSKLAGTPGYGPYRTYLRFAISPRNIRKLANEMDLEVETLACTSGFFVARSRFMRPLMTLIQQRGDCHVVLRKRFAGLH